MVGNYGQFQPPRGGFFLGTARASYLLLLFKLNNFKVSFKITLFTKKRWSHACADPKKGPPKIEFRLLARHQAKPLTPTGLQNPQTHRELGFVKALNIC